METSERARRAEGRLPSGRSDLPRQFIVKSQQERIVDATAAIVAEKGLAALTIPEIARRANVSNQTFYDIYASKHEAFLGAQKVGMHQALQVAIEALRRAGRRTGRGPSPPACWALLDYLASEPTHAHLTLVDTFAASPETIEIRNSQLQLWATYLRPGFELAGENAGRRCRRRGDRRRRLAGAAPLRRERMHRGAARRGAADDLLRARAVHRAAGRRARRSLLQARRRHRRRRLTHGRRRSASSGRPRRTRHARAGTAAF